MLHTVAVLFAFLAVAFARDGTDRAFEHGSFQQDDHARVFAKWRRHFNKKYDSIEDETHRFAVFLENWQRISEHNSQELSFKMGLNQFGDLTAKEFKIYVHGHEGSCLKGANKNLHIDSFNQKHSPDAPASVDWTAKGKVTAVKNQGQCGSCWAFSTTGSLESAQAIKAGSAPLSLSEQELVDCSGSYGNMGCQGGLMDDAFKYVKANGGLCLESAYAYTGRNGQCKKSCGAKKDGISGYTDVKSRSSSSLEAAVAQQPVSIAIEADQSSFQFYKSGVLKSACGTRLDHGVLAVGYGTEGSDDFWKVKNSWGASWGDAGYIKLCRNCAKNGGQGECGILDQPSYPTSL